MSCAALEKHSSVLLSSTVRGDRLKSSSLLSGFSLISYPNICLIRELLSPEEKEEEEEETEEGGTVSGERNRKTR